MNTELSSVMDLIKGRIRNYMESIKIVFFDVDGTLIDMSKKSISEKTLETLTRLKEKISFFVLRQGGVL